MTAEKELEHLKREIADTSTQSPLSSRSLFLPAGKQTKPRNSFDLMLVLAASLAVIGAGAHRSRAPHRRRMINYQQPINDLHQAINLVPNKAEGIALLYLGKISRSMAIALITMALAAMASSPSISSPRCELAGAAPVVATILKSNPSYALDESDRHCQRRCNITQFLGLDEEEERQLEEEKSDDLQNESTRYDKDPEEQKKEKDREKTKAVIKGLFGILDKFIN